MKKHFKLIYISLLTLALPSCLKDKFGASLSDIPGTFIVELAPKDDGATTSIDSRTKTISRLPSTLKAVDTISIPVYLGNTTGTLDYDVTVTLSRDTAAITKYNIVNGTNWRFFPENTIVSENLKVTIPAGKNIGYFKLLVNTLQVKPDDKYMAAYRITAVPKPLSISADRFYVHYKLIVKNKYDGLYSLRSGGMTDYQFAENTFIGSTTVDLVTVDDSTCIMRDAYAFNNGYLDPNGQPLNAHIFWSTASNSWSWYGYFCPVLHFNPNGNGQIIRVTNYFGQPDPVRGRSARLSPNPAEATASAWDPATRNVKVYYLMYDGTYQGGWQGAKVWFYDNLTFIKERP
ncbi:DUF1735 domain-containing protein [Chitinophaga nivalis]|uniref:DUF1735 domain-containing protein n=1 Tax=Chitinophaga nivalis TaxID=2991709 RepID=A0ABT3ISA3_9BACT|nr:DUF1735 domain-containing protein [Chitinophaga nivalis]MCW3463469.1 DUF1735 domain-containing protein [Chitinophaga nivalis]MCW3486841.1 DUF1735 domain-containing protein [Chitinophaga nivalis]